MGIETVSYSDLIGWSWTPNKERNPGQNYCSSVFDWLETGFMNDIILKDFYYFGGIEVMLFNYLSNTIIISDNKDLLFRITLKFIDDNKVLFLYQQQSGLVGKEEESEVSKWIIDNREELFLELGNSIKHIKEVLIHCPFYLSYVAIRKLSSEFEDMFKAVISCSEKVINVIYQDENTVIISLKFNDFFDSNPVVTCNSLVQNFKLELVTLQDWERFFIERIHAFTSQM